MNRVNSDRLPVKAEAHQSWPPKKQKRQSNNTKTTGKKKKEKYIVIHKITPEKYKKIINIRTTTWPWRVGRGQAISRKMPRLCHQNLRFLLLHPGRNHHSS